MQISISVLTIVMSGVVAAVVTYLLNSTKEQVFFIRKKAEDLYLPAEQFDSSISSQHIAAYPLIECKINYDQFYSLIIEKGGVSKGEHADSVHMLTKIYFPEIEPKLKAWISCLGKINKVLSEHKRAYKAGGANPAAFFKPFHEAVLAMDQAARAFKQAVVEQARQHSSAGALSPQQLKAKLWKSAKRERGSVK